MVTFCTLCDRILDLGEHTVIKRTPSRDTVLADGRVHILLKGELLRRKFNPRTPPVTIRPTAAVSTHRGKRPINTNQFKHVK